MATGPLQAVVTGGSKGIGLHLAAEIARRPRAHVVFGGRSPLESLPPATRALIAGLPPGSAHYRPVDVTDLASLGAFDGLVRRVLGYCPGRTVVIASAGLTALDKDADRVATMLQTNIAGTQNTFDAFRNLLAGNRGTFIPLSSIAATRGIVIHGNKGYYDTKVFTLNLARGIHPAVPHETTPIDAWALAPGAVRTDMTEEGVLFGSIGLAVAQRAPTDPVLRAGLGTYFGLPADSLDNMTTVLGAMFGDTSEGRALGMARSQLAKDPAVTSGRTQLVVASALSEGAVLARVAGLLVSLDIAMAPDVFARRVVDFIDGGTYPPDGVLEVFSAQEGNPSQAPILSYLNAFAT